MTDQLNHSTSYEYDLLNRKTKQTLPDPDGIAGPLASSVTTYAYDSNSNLTGVTDALGNVQGGNPVLHTTNYVYDFLNRQTAELQPSPDGVQARPTTSYAYDANNNLLTRTDAASNTTTYTYDALNRQVTQTNQLGSSRTTVYSQEGNVLRTTDRNGRVREFDYDHLGRLTAERWLDAGGATIRTISYAYDDKGRLTGISDPDSSYSYTYDNLDRVLSMDNNGTPNMPRVILSLTYDANGNRESVSTSVDGSSDFANAYLYDALNRLKQVTQTGAGVNSKRVDFSYTQNGQLDTVTRYGALDGSGTAVVSDYGYDDADRLTSLTHTRGAATVARYTWSFDSAGRITGFTSPDGDTTYSYDANGQLLGADYSAQTDENYTYDANGNRTNSGYQTGADNRLESDGTYSYTYDGEGNRLSATNIATGACILYTWDYRNRLTDITYKTSGTGTVTKQVHYTYDVNDLRIGKQVDSDGNGTWDSSERYAYDGQNIVMVFDGSGALTSRYLQTQAMDQTLAEEIPGEATRWLLPDNEGTIRDVVDSGTGQTHVTYDSFGEILTTTGNLPTPRFSYTGREWDADAGLFYYRARWYDAANGRFLSQDPIGFNAGDSNLYRYVGNGPVNYSDPSGLCKDGQQSMTSAQQAALDHLRDLAGKVGDGYLSGPLAVGNVTAVMDQLIGAGFDPSVVRDSVQPMVNALAAQTMLGQEQWYTALQTLQRSVSILTNGVTFGASNALNLTKSGQYQGYQFWGARAGTSVAQFGEAGVAFIAAGPAIGGMVDGVFGAGTAGVIGTVAGGGMAGWQIGQGINTVANGDYINGGSQIVLGAGSAALMGIGITNPDSIGTLGGAFNNWGMGTAAPQGFEVELPMARLSGASSFPEGTQFTTGPIPETYVMPADAPGLTLPPGEPISSTGLTGSSPFESHQWGNPDTIPCFPAEALVHTPIGVQTIESLRVGDLVLAYDEKRKSVVARKVTACMRNWTTMLVKLAVDGETIWATKNHPFYLPDEQKWIPACDLRAGMRLLDKELELRVIEDAQHMGTHEDTYNITVEEFHTFFVGEVGVLVHNSAFESTNSAFTEIYGVRNPAGNVVYVGKTIQGVDMRFQQHINSAHPEWANGYSVVRLDKGNWTPYEAAVWEQHYMDVNGGKTVLQNKQLAISQAKYNQFKPLHKPC